MPTINFNGKTYNNLEDMHANERQAFEQMSQMFVDKNGNGIPDFLEGDLAKNIIAASSSTFVYNGKTYNSLDEMPEDIRNKVHTAFDMMSGMGLVSKTAFSNMPFKPEQPAPSKPFIAPSNSSSAIEEEQGSNIFPYILGAIVLCFALVVLAFGISYFLNR